MRRRARWWLVGLGAAALLAAAAPALLRASWSFRSSNPVRRGVRLARELGCFACHGELGRAGLPDPTATAGDVPAWSGGVFMMYVEDDAEIRQYILDGVSERRRRSPTAAAERERQTIRMPAYRGMVGERQVDDLVAAFKVLSRMSLPEADTPERRGFDVAERWRCASCHGPAGSGGLPNPGSFAGFVPGWYGADFRDLVRGREEFDAWVRDGKIPRLAENAVASIFLRRQRISMPPYPNLTAEERDDLWAYVEWLARTGGGVREAQAAR